MLNTLKTSFQRKRLNKNVASSSKCRNKYDSNVFSRIIPILLNSKSDGHESSVNARSTMRRSKLEATHWICIRPLICRGDTFLPADNIASDLL